MGFPKRTDTNQTSLVRLFRSLGLSVAIISDLGKGMPDLIISNKRSNVLIEVKDGSKPPSQRKLTVDEQIFHDNWQGPLHIISSEQEAIALFDRMFHGLV